MIPVLRKLRYLFLVESKFRKYLLYAKGELILIVIGILIALQINNWNIRKIEATKERAYIVDFKKSLTQDLINIDNVLSFNRTKDSCIIRSLKLLGTKMDNGLSAFELQELLYTIGSYRILSTKFLLKYGKMKDFPTFQQDINIKRKHLDLTAAN